MVLPVGFFFRSEGFEQVPDTGPVIIAPNHTSYLDPYLISYPMRRPVYFLAWEGLFRSRLVGGALRRLGAIPLDTKRGSDRDAYEAALVLLRAGHAVALFPEGGRGWDGRLNPLRPGAGRLAAATGAPIFPVQLGGVFQAWPRWQRFPTFFRPVRSRCLAPLTPRPCRNPAERRAEAIRLTDSLEQALGEFPATME